MKITVETTLENFEAWSGAKYTKETILEAGKGEDFETLIEELYPNGMTDTELNDLLWHDSDWVIESLDIDTEEDEED